MSPVQPNSAAAAIADRIRTLRFELKMTQEQFAEYIYVTRSHLSHIETGRIEPSLRAILGVLVLDLRWNLQSAEQQVNGERFRCIDPTWLLLGPEFEKDMRGKVRHALLDRPWDDRDLLAYKAQYGIGIQRPADED